MMRNILKLEELFMFLISIYIFNLYDYPWWVYPALILAPDLGFLGYVINAKWGAIAYNLFHHKGLAVAVFFIGVAINNPAIQVAAIILFGHSSMDRMLGYGLKYPDGFNYTHLGMIGKLKTNQK